MEPPRLCRQKGFNRQLNIEELNIEEFEQEIDFNETIYRGNEPILNLDKKANSYTNLEELRSKNNTIPFLKKNYTF